MKKLLLIVFGALTAALGAFAAEKAPIGDGVYVEITHSGSDDELIFACVENFTLKLSDDFPLEHAKLIVRFKNPSGYSGSPHLLRNVGRSFRVGYLFDTLYDNNGKVDYAIAKVAYCGEKKSKCCGSSQLISRDDRYLKISLQKKVVLYPGVETAFAAWTWVPPKGNFYDLRPLIVSAPWPNPPRDGLYLTLVIPEAELAKRRAAAPCKAAPEVMSSLGVSADAIRSDWDHAELDRRAADVKEARNRFYSGTIGLPELLDRELAMIESLLRQPGMTASTLELQLRREYLKRLRKQLTMCKAAYEIGQATLDELRQKEREIAERCKEWGLPEQPSNRP